MYTEKVACGDRTLLTGFSPMILMASKRANHADDPTSPDRDQNRRKIQHQPQRPELPCKQRKQKQVTKHAEGDLCLNAPGLLVQFGFDRYEILTRP